MSLFDLFSADTGKQAAQTAHDARTGGLKKGFNTVKDYYGQAGEHYQTALQPWQTIGERGAAGADLYADAAGVNGPEGYARALSSFQTGPGYQFAMDQGLEAIDRRAAGRGMLNSGNTNMDTMRFAQGLANQEWQNWINSLVPLMQGEQNAAQGQTGIHGNLANLDTRVGDYGWQKETGIGQSSAQLASDQYAAEQQAGANQLNAIMSGANLAMMLSDRRLKKDIKRIGYADDGTPIYQYRYKAGGPTRIGVMAQDIEQTKPDAVVTMPNGYKAVDYGRAFGGV